MRLCETLYIKTTRWGDPNEGSPEKGTNDRNRQHENEQRPTGASGSSTTRGPREGAPSGVGLLWRELTVGGDDKVELAVVSLAESARQMFV